MHLEYYHYSITLQTGADQGGASEGPGPRTPPNYLIISTRLYRFCLYKLRRKVPQNCVIIIRGWYFVVKTMNTCDLLPRNKNSASATDSKDHWLANPARTPSKTWVSHMENQTWFFVETKQGWRIRILHLEEEIWKKWRYGLRWSGEWRKNSRRI